MPECRGCQCFKRLFGRSTSEDPRQTGLLADSHGTSLAVLPTIRAPIDDGQQDPSSSRTESKESTASNICQEELQMQLKSHPSEEPEWLDQLLRALWPRVEKAACKAIQKQLEPDSLRAHFKNLKDVPDKFKPALEPIAAGGVELTNFSIGKDPPKITSVRTDDASHGLKLRLRVTFRSNVAIAVKTDAKAESIAALTAMNLVSAAGFDNLAVNSIAIDGYMVIAFEPLLDKMPIVGGISVYFLDTPHILLKFANTSSFLHRLIKKTIDDAIAKSMVLPNSQNVPIAKADQLDHSLLLRPEGVLTLSKLKACDLEIGDVTTSDPYVIMKIGTAEQTTEVINRNLNPTWNARGYDFVVFDMEQQLSLEVWDSDWSSKHDLLGCIQSLTVQDIITHSRQSRKFKLYTRESQPCKGTVTLRFEWSPFLGPDFPIRTLRADYSAVRLIRVRFLELESSEYHKVTISVKFRDTTVSAKKKIKPVSGASKKTLSLIKRCSREDLELNQKQISWIANVPEEHLAEHFAINLSMYLAVGVGVPLDKDTQLDVDMEYKTEKSMRRVKAEACLKLEQLIKGKDVWINVKCDGQQLRHRVAVELFHLGSTWPGKRDAMLRQSQTFALGSLEDHSAIEEGITRSETMLDVTKQSPKWGLGSFFGRARGSPSNAPLQEDVSFGDSFAESQCQPDELPALSRALSQSDEPKWLEKLLEGLWPKVEPAAKEAIKKQLDPERLLEHINNLKDIPLAFKPMLHNILPIAEGGLELTELKLGERPPTITRVRADQDDGHGIKLRFQVHFDSEVAITVKANDKGKAAHKAIQSFGLDTWTIKHIKIDTYVVIAMEPFIDEMPMIGGMSVYFLKKPDIELTLDKSIPFLHWLVNNGIKDFIAKYFVLPRVKNAPLAKPDQLDHSLIHLYPEGVLTLSRLRGRDLEIKDLSWKPWRQGSSDPYVRMKLGPLEKKTETITKNLNPEWEDRGYEFVVFDMLQQVYLEVWDEDTVKADDFMGCTRLQTVKEIVANLTNQPVTFELYERDPETLLPDQKKQCKGFLTLCYQWAPFTFTPSMPTETRIKSLKADSRSPRLLRVRFGELGSTDFHKVQLTAKIGKDEFKVRKKIKPISEASKDAVSVVKRCFTQESLNLDHKQIGWIAEIPEHHVEDIKRRHLGSPSSSFSQENGNQRAPGSMINQSIYLPVGVDITPDTNLEVELAHKTEKSVTPVKGKLDLKLGNFLTFQEDGGKAEESLQGKGDGRRNGFQWIDVECGSEQIPVEIAVDLFQLCPESHGTIPSADIPEEAAPKAVVAAAPATATSATASTKAAPKHPAATAAPATATASPAAPKATSAAAAAVALPVTAPTATPLAVDPAAGVASPPVQSSSSSSSTPAKRAAPKQLKRAPTDYLDCEEPSSLPEAGSPEDAFCDSVERPAALPDLVEDEPSFGSAGDDEQSDAAAEAELPERQPSSSTFGALWNKVPSFRSKK